MKPYKLVVKVSLSTLILSCSAFTIKNTSYLTTTTLLPSSSSSSYLNNPKKNILLGHKKIRSSNATVKATAATAATTSTLKTIPMSIDDISIFVPTNFKESSTSDTWSKEAAALLREYGVVALRRQDGVTSSCRKNTTTSSTTDQQQQEQQQQGSNTGTSLIEESVCDGANIAAMARLKDMHRRVKNRGLDPYGIDEAYRFSEIICRDEGGKRFDVPIEWFGGSYGSDESGASSNNNKQHHQQQQKLQSAAPIVGSSRIGTPLLQKEVDAIGELHNDIDRIVKPVMEHLWSAEASPSSFVAAAGFLINQPGSSSQNWHKDGPDEGYIDCFVPLIDLNEAIGPTAIQPGTHLVSTPHDEEKDDTDVLVPILKKGDILLFDYRTIHRGQANRSPSTTRTLAYAVYKRRQELCDNGDIHNFPAALTLEFD